MPCESEDGKKPLLLHILSRKFSAQDKTSPKLRTENKPAKKLIQDFFVNILYQSTPLWRWRAHISMGIRICTVKHA